MPIHGYLGGVISATAPTVSVSGASGIFTLEEQMQAAGTWPIAGLYPITRSVRIRASASAYFNRTIGTPTNNKICTLSVWLKRGALQSAGSMGLIGTSGGDYIGFNNDNMEIRQLSGGGGRKITTAVFRDPSAWYHFVFQLDTTDATAANRIKIWQNGVQLTSFSLSTDPSQNSTWSFNVASAAVRLATDFSSYFDGYLTEMYFIDGQSLAPTSFGAFDATTGVWNPIKYTGTYGTNGFYLNFSDNSAATAAALGKDSSGNGNNWTPNNISVTAGVTYDSMVDSPTNYGTDTGVGGEVRGNYVVLNAVDAATAPSDGNLRLVSGNANYGVRSTIQLPSSGKWYAECIFGTTTSANVGLQFGFATASASLTNGPSTSGKYGIYADTSGYIFSNTTTLTSGLGVISSGTVLQIAYDGATGNAWVGKANVWYNSSGGTTGNPATGANPTFTSLSSVFVYVQGINGTQNFNAGQTAFSYTAPSGFKALCTQNLTTPTISNGANYMAATLWTGTGVGSRAITNTSNGVSFQPDWVWLKGRSGSTNPQTNDSVRGATNGCLYTSLTNAVDANFPLISFDSSGFTLGNTASLISQSFVSQNGTGYTYVGWQWKASGSTVSNTTGSITSTVNANTTAGFSILTYTGNGTVGATVGHGLGVTPGMVIVKSRSAAADWPVKILPYMAGGARLELDTTNAITTEAAGPGSLWNATNPNSTVITLGDQAMTNTNSTTYVAYCFAAISGYSAFGSYTGNGSTDGPFLYLGFRPRFVMCKRTDTSGNWMMIDSSRSPYNLCVGAVFANVANAEDSTSPYDFVANGYKIRSTTTEANTSSGTYIYAAFAENPFTISRAR